MKFERQSQCVETRTLLGVRTPEGEGTAALAVRERRVHLQGHLIQHYATHCRLSAFTLRALSSVALSSALCNHLL